MASQDVQDQLEVVSTQLVQIPDSMRQFSLSMRSLFVENAVGTSSDTAERFRKLRDDTRNNAVAYVEGALPVVKQCVSDIKGYFEYYLDLSMEDWSENIDYIIEEARAHKETCSALIVIHENMKVELKKQENDAKILMCEMKDLSAEYERRANDLKTSAKFKNAIACTLSLVPRINVIAAPLFTLMACYDEAQAVASAKEAEIQIAAVAAVRDALVPALTNFLEGLRHIAGFFQVIEEELETFQNKGTKAKEEESKRLRKLHYNVMKGKAGRIMGGCQSFFAVLPSIRSDLEAIPTEGVDRNYVDRWMQNQRRIILEKCSKEDVIKKLMDVINRDGN